MTRTLLLTLALTLDSAPSLRGEEMLSRYSFSEPHMGTRFGITLYAPSQQQAEQAARAAFDRIGFLDATMSDYRPTSELMRLVGKAGGPPVKVSKELFFVLRQAEAVSRRSDGAFDVTMGPVIRLWRLARRTQRLPPPDKLSAARDLVGYRRLRLDPKGQTAQLLQAGMRLDLGGIAKGHAADEAHAVLRKHGITRALVAAGGDITVSDPPPDAKGWTIAVTPPDPMQDEPYPTLLLHNASVSTSGDLNQYVEIDGRRYSHIVDPRTGLGLPGRMSVTVIAPTGIQADSLATAISILGPEKGLELARATPGVEARYVRLTEKGRETFTTKGFPTLK